MAELTDRINELRLENRRLKQQIEDFEKRVLNLVGNTIIEASGEGENKELLNEMIIDFIQTSQDQMNIVSPKLDEFYIKELERAAGKGIPILLITRDRYLWEKKERGLYDELLNIPGMSVINNPNVNYLLIFNTEIALYAGGVLDKELLSKSVLILTTIKEDAKIRKIADIFSAMLPSFMR